MPNRPLTRVLGGLPHLSKRRLKKLLYLPDTIRRSLGRDGFADTPPKWLMFDSASDYQAIGKHLLDLCTRFAELAPEHRVLDIGCGVGRLASPLTGYLGAAGSYEGFDVDHEAIVWCQENISPSAPNFVFTHIEVTNDHYSRTGGRSANEFLFPYADNSFDMAVATSVFTHLTLEDAAQYVRESARVLKPGGVLLSTWYLVSAEATQDPTSVQNRFQTRLEDHSFTDTPRNPCAGIAFAQDSALSLYEQCGLSLVQPPLDGEWKSSEGPTFQDLLVARKAQS